MTKGMYDKPINLRNDHGTTTEKGGTTTKKDLEILTFFKLFTVKLKN